MAQYLSTCMPWEIVVSVEYRDKAWHSISIPLLKAHCKPSCNARREHKSREFRVTKLPTLVKGFSKDLVSVRTAQAIRCKNIVIHLNGTGYPFEKGISSLRTTIHSRKIVIRSRSNGSGCPLEKCHPFERLELSVQNNCHPCYCSKPLSPELLIATNVSKNVSLYK